MSSWIAGLIAPHYCIACGEVGEILCLRCQDDITSDPYERCLVCGSLSSPANLCNRCKEPYKQAWCIGVRNGSLKQLIDDFKFQRLREGHVPIGRMFHAILPQFPASVVVTHIPTIAPHIRKRGYDHAQLIAREFARKRDMHFASLLERATNVVQVGATKAQRSRQAANAFRVRKLAYIPDRVLLIDDVYTTGATLRSAATLLRENGVKEVFVAVVARQTLDE